MLVRETFRGFSKIDILLGGFSGLAKISEMWGREASFVGMDGDAEVGFIF